MGPLPPAAQWQAKGGLRRGLPLNTWSTAEPHPGREPHVLPRHYHLKSPVGAPDRETAGGGGRGQAGLGSLLPGCINSFTLQRTREGLRWAGRNQHLGCLPVPLAGGWAYGHRLPRPGMSRSGTRSSGQCCPLSGQGGPSCLCSEGLGFTPTPMVLGLGVLLGQSRAPTFPVAHPSSFGGAGLVQLEPTWLARSGLASLPPSWQLLLKASWVLWVIVPVKHIPSPLPAGRLVCEMCEPGSMGSAQGHGGDTEVPS